MPLSDDLLTPIPGANPAGENLRYAPLYDKIKEARREDDDAPQGEWRRERKLADWSLTVKLITEALSKKSKDLQLAAWLTEALVRRNGMSGLQEGLQVLHGMVETFWDSLYPEIEDGAAPMGRRQARKRGEERAFDPQRIRLLQIQGIARRRLRTGRRGK
jgi:type VI secretion system protein ImpA